MKTITISVGHGSLVGKGRRPRGRGRLNHRGIPDAAGAQFATSSTRTTSGGARARGTGGEQHETPSMRRGPRNCCRHWYGGDDPSGRRVCRSIGRAVAWRVAGREPGFGGTGFEDGARGGVVWGVDTTRGGGLRPSRTGVRRHVGPRPGLRLDGIDVRAGARGVDQQLRWRADLGQRRATASTTAATSTSTAATSTNQYGHRHGLRGVDGRVYVYGYVYRHPAGRRGRVVAPGDCCPARR